MPDMMDLVEIWKDRRGYHQFEGDSGVDRLSELCSAIGYRGDGFKNGSPIESFLADNPGAIERVLDFICEQGYVHEWKENLAQEIGPVVSDDCYLEDEDEI